MTADSQGDTLSFDAMSFLHQSALELQLQVEVECRRAAERFRLLKTWEQTCDLASRVWVSLLEAIRSKKIVPTSNEHFWNVVRLHIKWAVLDAARKVSGRPWGVDPSSVSIPEEATPVGHGFEWSAFHAAVAELPDSERRVFESIWYDNLKREEIATLTGFSISKVQRLYRSARENLMTVTANS